MFCDGVRCSLFRVDGGLRRGPLATSLVMRETSRVLRRGYARLVAAAFILAVAACSSDPEVIDEPDSTPADGTGSVTSGVTTSIAAGSAPVSEEPTESTPTTEPATTASATTEPQTTVPPTTEASGPAEVGSTITLEGTDSRIAVTVTAVADPAPPVEFFEPEQRSRYVAVQLRLLNVGDTTFQDSPSNGAQLIDADNQQHAATFETTAVGPDLGSVTIAAGDTRSGWLTFPLPESIVPERFTLALDSGFAEQTGEWLLTSGTPTDPSPPVLVPESGPGDAITLEGLDGEQVEVTPVAVADPAPPGEFDQPGRGERFVAVQLRLSNVGDVTYSDSPSNGLVMIDSKGQVWDPAFVDSGVGPGFEGGSVRLAPGDERLGWVTFKAPADAALAKLTMALSSGFAEQVGEWRLTGPT
jgi:Domain of unknown function (DUF4352)